MHASSVATLLEGAALAQLVIRLPTLKKLKLYNHRFKSTENHPAPLRDEKRGEEWCK